MIVFSAGGTHEHNMRIHGGDVSGYKVMAGLWEKSGGGLQWVGQ
jgi:hypothetical protein